LIQHFDVSLEQGQPELQLFILLAAVAAGAVHRGPFGDKVDREPAIGVSVLGALPFDPLPPRVDLFWTRPPRIPMTLQNSLGREPPLAFSVFRPWREHAVAEYGLVSTDCWFPDTVTLLSFV
jgi:hypothetical protein